MWRERRRAACRQRGQGARGRGHRAGRAGQRKKKRAGDRGQGTRLVLYGYCKGCYKVTTRQRYHKRYYKSTKRAQDEYNKDALGFGALAFKV